MAAIAIKDDKNQLCINLPSGLGKTAARLVALLMVVSAMVGVAHLTGVLRAL